MRAAAVHPPIHTIINQGWGCVCPVFFLTFFTSANVVGRRRAYGRYGVVLV
jgi:hypothetical protein